MNESHETGVRNSLFALLAVILLVLVVILTGINIDREREQMVWSVEMTFPDTQQRDERARDAAIALEDTVHSLHVQHQPALLRKWGNKSLLKATIIFAPPPTAKENPKEWAQSFLTTISKAITPFKDANGRIETIQLSSKEENILVEGLFRWDKEGGHFIQKAATTLHTPKEK